MVQPPFFIEALFIDIRLPQGCRSYCQAGPAPLFESSRILKNFARRRNVKFE